MKMKRYKVTINEVYNPETEEKYNALYFNGELFDWGLDEKELIKAKDFCCEDNFFMKTIHGDICKYFTSCIEEILGKQVSIKEINEAIKKGYIDC